MNQATAESAAARPGPPGAAAPADDDERPRRSRARVGLISFGALGLVLGAIVVAFSLTGGSDAPPPNDFGSASAPQSPAGGQGAASGASSSSPLTTADRRATNVAVLNGTTQTGLARNVGDKISEKGFTIGGVATNADQSVPATVVAYTPGNENAALAVARIIGVGRRAVKPADANTSAAANADVVVTVGADKLG